MFVRAVWRQERLIDVRLEIGIGVQPRDGRGAVIVEPVETEEHRAFQRLREAPREPGLPASQ